ncbi:hypothetical protein DK847_16715 [Aestuariivirga litoralis]|uniref:HD domain-containing protein n=1 Tax=Aestuariivirga litoralis TaxID=2650924 RepID=A0A2W2AQH4_9HYPH|nr:hypothetical protein DK847_16715 [Aestuariivirga litoralis]
MLNLNDVDTVELLREAESRFTLGKRSVHGPLHWRAVFSNGILLADELQADKALIAVFALLHDCRRENERDDPRHGARAAVVARELNGRFFEFEEERLERLAEALHWHDAGKVHEDLDISCCWAADRIELRRVGIEPAKWGFCDRTWPVARQILAARRGANAATA